MDARELRIRNLVLRTNKQTKEKLLIELTASDILDISANGVLSSFNYEPIPLTEEWFPKFYAIKVGSNIQIGVIILWKNINDGMMYFRFEGVSLKISFIHELQNLYFALTNTELTLKLNVSND